MNDPRNTAASPASPEEGRDSSVGAAPDSGRIHVLTPPASAQAPIRSIQAKMLASELLTAAEIAVLEAAADKIMAQAELQRNYGYQLVADADAVTDAATRAKVTKGVFADYQLMFAAAETRLKNLGFEESAKDEPKIIETTAEPMPEAVAQSVGGEVSQVITIPPTVASVQTGPVSNPRRSLFPNSVLTQPIAEPTIEIDVVDEQLGTARELAADEADAEGVEKFFTHTIDTEHVKHHSVKRRFLDFLDEKSFDYNDSAADVEYQSRKKSGSTLKKVGAAMVDGVRFVEGIFSPKSGMFRNVKNLQENDKLEAKKALEKDLTYINSGIEAISMYVNMNHGKTFHLGDMDKKDMKAFVDHCLTNPKSPHYAHIKSIMVGMAKERIAQYNQQIANIDADASYSGAVKEMLDDSLYLRAKERVFGGKKTTPVKPSWLDEKVMLPVMNMVVTYGMLQNAVLHDADHISERHEQTVVTNVEKLKEEADKAKWDNRKKKMGWAAAAVAAAGMAVLGGVGIYRTAKPKKDTMAQVVDKVAESSPKVDGSAEAAGSPAPTENVAVADQPKVENTPEEKGAEAPAVGSKVAKEPVKVASAVSHPKAAKSVKIAKDPIVDASKGSNPEKQADTAVDENKKELTPTEIAAAKRIANANISAYRRHLDITLGGDRAPDKADEDKLVGSINNLAASLKELHTKGDVKTLDKLYTEIEGELSDMDHHIAAQKAGAKVIKNIVDADIYANVALNKVRDLKKKMAGKGTKFTIRHQTARNVDGNAVSTVVVPYSYDLNYVESQLSRIAEEVKAGKSFGLSPMQAEFDAKDAIHWNQVANFVEWYDLYNPQAITYSK